MDGSTEPQESNHRNLKCHFLGIYLIDQHKVELNFEVADELMGRWMEPNGTMLDKNLSAAAKSLRIRQRFTGQQEDGAKPSTKATKQLFRLKYMHMLE